MRGKHFNRWFQTRKWCLITRPIRTTETRLEDDIDPARRSIRPMVNSHTYTTKNPFPIIKTEKKKQQKKLDNGRLVAWLRAWKRRRVVPCDRLSCLLLARTISRLSLLLLPYTLLAVDTTLDRNCIPIVLLNAVLNAGAVLLWLWPIDFFFKVNFGGGGGGGGGW